MTRAVLTLVLGGLLLAYGFAAPVDDALGWIVLFPGGWLVGNSIHRIREARS